MQAVILSVLASTGCVSSYRSLYVVAVPVADLRARPGSLPATAMHDPLQETQLLYDERVRLIRTEDRWALVEAIEQPEYTHHRRWDGYPGWILRDLLQPLTSCPQPPNAIVTSKWGTVWQDARGTTPLIRLPMGSEVALTRQQGCRPALRGGFQPVRRVRFIRHPRTQRKGRQRAPASVGRGNLGFPSELTGADGPLVPLALLNGTTGWIAQGDVASIRQLDRLSDEARRRLIVRAAEQFLGDPYFWGGRSPSPASARSPVTGLPVAFATQTGVDCSGLINLAYRAAGVQIPRDAHEQYLRARKITTLKSADLIFLSEEGNAKQIVHVMLYAGDGWLIEGPGTGLSIRRIDVTKRFGRALEQLHAGDRIERHTLFFGAYLR